MDSLFEIFHQGGPALGIALVALGGLGEYLFPPLPGDTVMLFGFFLAGHGDLPFMGVLLAALAGSMVGAHLSFLLGSRLGHSYFFIRRSRIAKSVLPILERYFARFGVGMILVNRFLPVLRGFFLFAAGMGGMPRMATFLCATASNLAWILLIAWVGHRFGTSWERLQEIFRAYAGILSVLFLAYASFTVLKYRLRRKAPPAA
ncbi:MAG TPA: DedA family protein [Candidatus Polarisedimenticolia bacterium]|nr:DedA family protein [Candidatus Polarisedimenticolia bacterium]